MDFTPLASTTATSNTYTRFVGCGLYALALITGSMGFLLNSASLIAPSLFAGSVVLIAAILFAALVFHDERDRRRAERPSRQSDWVLERAS